jgi:hypothetical protein
MPDGNNPQARLLVGLILVAEGGLSRKALDQAVERQRALRATGVVQPLGQILLEAGAVTEAQVRHALALQRRLGAGPAERVTLVVQLIRNGIVAPSLLATKLDEAERRHVPLATLLAEDGLATEALISHLTTS